LIARFWRVVEVNELDYVVSRKIEDSGEAERLFRREAERHSGIVPNTIGA
jgi:hypothetical protein